MPTMTETEVLRGPLSLTFPELVRGVAPEPRPKQDTTVTTFGWDTVFAVRPADLNAAIIAQNTTPPRFNQTEDGTTIDGTFGPWQVTTGGGDEKVNLNVPIPTGSLTYNGVNYPMDGSQAVITVQLQYLPQPQGNTQNLVVNQQQQDPVSIQSFTVPGSIDPLVKYIMQGLLGSWFNANLGAFTQVFNTVSLNNLNQDGSYPYLTPTYTGYGYVDGLDQNGNPSLADSVFGVLCRTTSGPQPLPSEVSPQAIPQGDRGAFLMAPWLYLRYGVIPVLPDMFVNSSEADFAYDPAAQNIYNVNQVQMQDVKIGGVNYTPYIAPNSLSISITGTEIIINLTQVHVHITAGIDLYVDHTTWQTVYLQTQSNGKQTLMYKQTRDPYTNHNVEVGKGVIIGSIIAGIIAGAIGALVGAAGFEKLAARVISGVLAALLLGLLSSIAGILQAVVEGDADKLPPIDLLVANATAPFTWPNTNGEFTLTDAELNGSMQLIGNPGFA